MRNMIPIQPSSEGIQEFQKIYETESGKKISYEEAEIYSRQLLEFIVTAFEIESKKNS